MKCLAVLLIAVGFAAAQTCPNGGKVYARGISQQGKQDVVDAHNKYRLDIANGRVAGQPRGTNLKRMYWDQILSDKGRVVSNTCKMEHKSISDNRFWWVGQNLGISWSSQQNCDQDWKGIVAMWFNEKDNFIYPDRSSNGKATGHYTQVVWADSASLGCDFICFYDKSKPQYPYAKLYTCNYGPGGNVQGQAPYKTEGSGCSNLC